MIKCDKQQCHCAKWCFHNEMQREVDCVDLSEQETLQEFCNSYQSGNKTVCQAIKLIFQFQERVCCLTMK